ncbi:MAG TPA: protoglobin domain-containing protein [Phycisphaerales bacterium]|nr:protoglobin domain-containing protein [Phycisphaerales bacterium]
MHRSASLTVAAAVLGSALLGAGAGTGAGQPEIPGYTRGSEALEAAPITLGEFEKIKATALLTDEDVRYLRMSKEVLAPHVEELVGVWYGFVGSQPHLLESFVDRESGEPDADYLARVRDRFEQWVLDTASAEYDQEWLDYQFEIARRHHRSGKNRTDSADAAPIVPFRYIPVLVVPVTTTLKPFLARGGHSPEEIEKMHAAWVKSVTVQATLWSYPYVEEGGF